MEKNPFNELIGIFREEGAHTNEPPFFLGTIVSALPNLQIATQGIIISKESILIDKWLLDKSKALSTNLSDGHTHSMDLALKDCFSKGDTVVLLRNENKFVLISKVVQL